MTDWLEQLIGKSPLAWQEGWWAAANGGMWSICLAAKHGRLALAEQDILQQLLERLPERLPALQYLIRQEGLVKEQADAILQRAQRMIQWAVGDNEVPILDRVAFEQPQREIWLQGLGVTRANTGFVVRITLQRWDHPAGVSAEYRDSWSYLQPHPASCLMPADSSFLATLGIVRQWCRRFALPQSFVMWKIEQSDGMLRGFQGDSLGAAITVGLHHLLDETLPPLDPSITISAAVSDEGRFHPVSGLKAKVRVGRFRASPPLRHLLVASNQDLSEINPSDGLFDFVVPTATLDEAIEFFQVQARPFEAVRQQAIQQTRHLLAIGIKPVEWTVYQEPQVCGLNPQTGQEGEGTRLSECVYRTFEETNEGICLITAPSGGGKSSALSYLAHQIVGGQALPVLLSADQWESCWQANPHFDLPAILHHLYQSLANAPSIEHWRQWLQQGRAVLLVDKLESVAPNQSFRDHLRQVLQTFPLLRAVFAVQVEWLSWFEALALPMYRLLPLSEAQTHALVRSLEDLLGRSTPHAASFAGNPFLCTAACFIDGTPPTG